MPMQSRKRHARQRETTTKPSDPRIFCDQSMMDAKPPPGRSRKSRYRMRDVDKAGDGY
jgi:hypothetical protein